MTVRQSVLLFALIPVLLVLSSVRSASAQEVVLYASQASRVGSGWLPVADGTAAGGARLTNPDLGAGKLSAPLANPSTYAQLSFNAVAGRPYRIWIRARTLNNSPYNDSIYIQFSGSVNSAGSAVYRIGTTSGVDINLEECSGCGLSNWGWQDNGWGVGVLGPQIYFSSTGTQTLRIQTREDGLSIDQIVISPSAYLNKAPGSAKNDTTILPQSNGAVSAPAPTPAPTPTPTPTPTPIPTPIPTPAPSSDDIVIWATNVPSTSIKGQWFKKSNSSAAGQTVLHNPDSGAAKVTSPSANPSDYFEVTFSAVAGRPYRIWVRARADNNYWGNDSVYAQFSNSLNILGSPAFRIGTSSAVDINLEDCSGCGLSNWGWQDNGWGVGILGPTIFFQNTGTQTLRIQRREDGVSIDQIVISSYAFLYGSPGLLKNDNTILQSTLGTAPAPTPTPTPTPANKAPSVNIAASPTSGTSPLFVSFSSAASDSDGYITSYSWNFGNGTTSTVQNPTTTYQSAGTYTATLTVTDDDGAKSSATVQINVSAPLTSTGTLRVLSWNVAFGKGTDNIQNWDRTATWIKNMNADLVALCEMPSGDISTLVSLLSQKTGRTWYSHFLAKYSGTTEGNLILSKYPLSGTGGRYLSYQRSVAKATLTVAGRTINFFATHFDPDSSGVRYTQAGELLSYASGFGEQRILAGDFNSGPDTSESVRMTSAYYDSWMRAMNAGTATAYADNPIGMHTRTRRGRIDYVYYSHAAGSLVLKGTSIPDTRDLNNKNVVVYLGTADDKGVRPSDHNPMIANFEIR